MAAYLGGHGGLAHGPKCPMAYGRAMAGVDMFPTVLVGENTSDRRCCC
jgi:hypothetical protein